MSPFLLRRLRSAVARRRERSRKLEKRRVALLPHYSFEAHGRRRLNVTLVLRDARKPTSSTFIRLLSPLSRPAFGRVGLDVVDPRMLHVSRRSQVCIVQRTAFDRTDTARQLVALARRRGCVLVVDNDDAFSALDPGHPQYARQAERAQVLDDVMGEADEVWLSTEALRASHGLPSAVVVPNSLDPALWRPELVPAAETDPEAPLRLLYMGTATHDGDLAMVTPALDRLHDAHPGAFVVVMVGIASELVERPWMQVLTPPKRSYQRFVPWLVSSGPFDLGLSPLVDSAFNRAKSDVKCLDYLALGARPVVSDLVPYAGADLDGLVDRVPDGPDAWFAALEPYVVDRAGWRRDAASSRAAGIDHVVSTRSADGTAAILRARLDDLMSSSSTHS